MPTETVTAPSSAKSLTTLAYGRLRADILSGQLRPDERLRIQPLSERYETGATAIREALSRLVPDGLVLSEDQRGFRVPPISRDELLDLTQTRIDIEGVALGHAIERGGIDWESNLLSAFHRLSRTTPSADPQGGWADVHRHFHEALLAGCGSPWTLRLCRLLYDKLERYRNIANQHTTPQRRDTTTEHRVLMDAAMARDAARAKELLAKHFRETAEIALVVFDGVRQRPKTARRGAPKRTA